MTEQPAARTTAQLREALARGARITTITGTVVYDRPRSVHDTCPWTDRFGTRYPASMCVVLHHGERPPPPPTPAQRRRIAADTGIDWEQILGRARP
ncbi:hypothetical protein ACFVGM_09075 [Kitasatospora purpeofusca]|uniref:hypothetical protein n=1 Tax=Kitasatospora purpeofusca TaxID=67352 RepID=UPI0036C2087E